MHSSARPQLTFATCSSVQCPPWFYMQRKSQASFSFPKGSFHLVGASDKANRAEKQWSIPGFCLLFSAFVSAAASFPLPKLDPISIVNISMLMQAQYPKFPCPLALRLSLLTKLMVAIPIILLMFSMYVLLVLLEMA